MSKFNYRWIFRRYTVMAHCVLRSVLDDIRSQTYYSLIVDETRDVSGKEQLAISLRWVNSSYEIFEDLIGLVEVERTDASSLKSVIKRYPYPLQHSIRQLSRPSIWWGGKYGRTFEWGSCTDPERGTKGSVCTLLGSFHKSLSPRMWAKITTGMRCPCSGKWVAQPCPLVT